MKKLELSNNLPESLKKKLSKEYSDAALINSLSGDVLFYIKDIFESYNSEDAVDRYFVHSILPNMLKSLLDEFNIYYSEIIKFKVNADCSKTDFSKEDLLEEAFILVEECFFSDDSKVMRSDSRSLTLVTTAPISEETYKNALWRMLKAIYMNNLHILVKPTDCLDHWIVKWNPALLTKNGASSQKTLVCDLFFIKNDSETAIVLSVKDTE